MTKTSRELLPWLVPAALLAAFAIHLRTSADIVRAPDLSHEQKVKLLHQWDYDLQLLLTATEENMPGSENTARYSSRCAGVARA